MPKLKTYKTGSKRFKITGSGKILRVPAAKNHLLTNKTDRKKGFVAVSANDKSKVKKLIRKG